MVRLAGIDTDIELHCIALNWIGSASRTGEYMLVIFRLTSSFELGARSVMPDEALTRSVCC